MAEGLLGRCVQLFANILIGCMVGFVIGPTGRKALVRLRRVGPEQDEVLAQMPEGL